MSEATATNVQYMRGYTIEEMAVLQEKVQAVFAETPSIVGAAVIAHELLIRLRGERCEDDPPIVEPSCKEIPTPAPIQAVVDALEGAVPLLIGLSHDGLSRKEVIS